MEILGAEAPEDDDNQIYEDPMELMNKIQSDGHT